MTNKHRAPEPDTTDVVNVQLDWMDDADRVAFERMAQTQGVDLGRLIADYAVRGLHQRGNVNYGSAGTVLQTGNISGGLRL